MRGEQYPVAGMKLPVGILRQPLKKAIDTFVTGRSIREIGVKTSLGERIVERIGGGVDGGDGVGIGCPRRGESGSGNEDNERNHGS